MISDKNYDYGMMKDSSYTFIELQQAFASTLLKLSILSSFIPKLSTLSLSQSTTITTFSSSLSNTITKTIPITRA
jgi:hypothetical protein